jgi:hypothetical protein
MKPLFFIVAIVLQAFSPHGLTQEAYKSPEITLPTLEATSAAMENLRKQRTVSSPTARLIVDNPLIEHSIVIDLVQQHESCFFADQARKVNKTVLLDHELSDAQRQKKNAIYSGPYIKDLMQAPIFGAMKILIASAISQSSDKTLAKAIDLLEDDVGQNFVLAWLDSFKRNVIDKSCGTFPDQTVSEFWKQELFWRVQAKKFELD